MRPGHPGYRPQPTALAVDTAGAVLYQGRVSRFATIALLLLVLVGGLAAQQQFDPGQGDQILIGTLWPGSQNARLHEDLKRPRVKSVQPSADGRSARIIWRGADDLTDQITTWTPAGSAGASTPARNQVPSTGISGQVLESRAGAQAVWSADSLPAGGSDGQVLSRDASGSAVWTDQTGGLDEAEVKAEIRPEGQADLASLTAMQQAAARARNWGSTRPTTRPPKRSSRSCLHTRS